MKEITDPTDTIPRWRDGIPPLDQFSKLHCSSATNLVTTQKKIVVLETSRRWLSVDDIGLFPRLLGSVAEQSSLESQSTGSVISPPLTVYPYQKETRVYLHGETGEQIVPGPLAERLQLHVSRALVHLARPRPHGAGLELARVVLNGLEVQRTRLDHVRIDLRDFTETGGVALD